MNINTYHAGKLSTCRLTSFQAISLLPMWFCSEPVQAWVLGLWRKSFAVVSVSSECLGKLYQILNSIHMVLLYVSQYSPSDLFYCSFVLKVSTPKWDVLPMWHNVMGIMLKVSVCLNRSIVYLANKILLTSYISMLYVKCDVSESCCIGSSIFLQCLYYVLLDLDFFHQRKDLVIESLLVNGCTSPGIHASLLYN